MPTTRTFFLFFLFLFAALSVPVTGCLLDTIVVTLCLLFAKAILQAAWSVGLKKYPESVTSDPQHPSKYVSLKDLTPDLWSELSSLRVAKEKAEIFGSKWFHKYKVLLKKSNENKRELQYLRKEVTELRSYLEKYDQRIDTITKYVNFYIRDEYGLGRLSPVKHKDRLMSLELFKDLHEIRLETSAEYKEKIKSLEAQLAEMKSAASQTDHMQARKRFEGVDVGVQTAFETTNEPDLFTSGSEEVITLKEDIVNSYSPAPQTEADLSLISEDEGQDSPEDHLTEIECESTLYSEIANKVNTVPKDPIWHIRECVLTEANEGLAVGGVGSDCSKKVGKPHESQETAVRMVSNSTEMTNIMDESSQTDDTMVLELVELYSDQMTLRKKARKVKMSKIETAEPETEQNQSDTAEKPTDPCNLFDNQEISSVPDSVNQASNLAYDKGCDTHRSPYIPQHEEQPDEELIQCQHDESFHAETVPIRPDEVKTLDSSSYQIIQATDELNDVVQLENTNLGLNRDDTAECHGEAEYETRNEGLMETVCEMLPSVDNNNDLLAQSMDMDTEDENFLADFILGLGSLSSPVQQHFDPTDAESTIMGVEQDAIQVDDILSLADVPDFCPPRVETNHVRPSSYTTPDEEMTDRLPELENAATSEIFQFSPDYDMSDFFAEDLDNGRGVLQTSNETVASQSGPLTVVQSSTTFMPFGNPTTSFSSFSFQPAPFASQISTPVPSTMTNPTPQQYLAPTRPSGPNFMRNRSQAKHHQKKKVQHKSLNGHAILENFAQPPSQHPQLYTSQYNSFQQFSMPSSHNSPGPQQIVYERPILPARGWTQRQAFKGMNTSMSFNRFNRPSPLPSLRNLNAINSDLSDNEKDNSIEIKTDRHSSSEDRELMDCPSSDQDSETSSISSIRSSELLCITDLLQENGHQPTPQINQLDSLLDSGNDNDSVNHAVSNVDNEFAPGGFEEENGNHESTKKEATLDVDFTASDDFFESDRQQQYQQAGELFKKIRYFVELERIYRTQIEQLEPQKQANFQKFQLDVAHEGLKNAQQSLDGYNHIRDLEAMEFDTELTLDPDFALPTNLESKTLADIRVEAVERLQRYNQVEAANLLARAYEDQTPALYATRGGHSGDST